MKFLGKIMKNYRKTEDKLYPNLTMLFIFYLIGRIQT